MDVNEEIVREWLHLCQSQFTIDDINFKVYGPKGGSNYSNIDLLAVDAQGRYYDYEIKWRSVYSIGATADETPEWLVTQMTRKERVEKIQTIIGNHDCKRILVTSKTFFGKSVQKRAKHTEFFRSHGIEIVYFEDIVSDLIGKVSLNGRYNSMLLQIVRMLKQFGFINIEAREIT
jgi:hypothetical protein